MPVTIRCPHCATHSAIPQESLGHPVRCPKCQQNFESRAPVVQPVVPRAVVPRAVVVAPRANPQTPGVWNAPPPVAMPISTKVWYLRTPDGQSFGPVGKQELDSWVAEGAVPGDSLLLQQGASQWQTAREVYPILAGSGENNIFVNVGAPSSSGMAGTSSSKVKQPHRANLVMILAVLGWFAVPILSIVAWVMAANDLKQMRIGRMDRSGESMTFWAMTMGMVGTFILALYVILVVAIALGLTKLR